MRWRRPESCGGVERIRNPVSNGTFISEIYFGVIRPARGVWYHGGDFGSDVLYFSLPCFAQQASFLHCRSTGQFWVLVENQRWQHKWTSEDGIGSFTRGATFAGHGSARTTECIYCKYTVYSGIGMIYDQTPFPSGVSSQKDLHCQESRERREVKQPD